MTLRSIYIFFFFCILIQAEKARSTVYVHNFYRLTDLHILGRDKKTNQKRIQH